MPQTTQSNFIKTLEGLGANERITGFFLGYEYGRSINPAGSGGMIQVPDLEPDRQRGRQSKAAQSILATLTATTEGMTQTAITAAVGPTVKANRIAPTLETMKKANLIYNKKAKWFSGTAPTKTEQMQKPQRSRRGRPPGPSTKRASDSSITLADATLKAVSSGFTTPTTILAELGRTYGMTVKPNHLGIALVRHFKAGRLTKTGEGKNTVWTSTLTGQGIARAA